MGIRELAGDMARNTSGLWRGIADTVDPDGRRKSRPAHVSTEPAAAEPDHAVDDFGEHGGRMVVPLDTWTRILEQVGNVHEAGQQLADARERAARAETENVFLHEQIKDLKSQRRPQRRAPAPTASEPVASPTIGAEPGPESRQTRARRQMSKWISP